MVVVASLVWIGYTVLMAWGASMALAIALLCIVGTYAVIRRIARSMRKR